MLDYIHEISDNNNVRNEPYTTPKERDMYYGDDSFDTQTSSDELTPEYQPTDQDYRDMAEAWGLDANGDSDESMHDDEETEDFEW